MRSVFLGGPPSAQPIAIMSLGEPPSSRPRGLQDIFTRIWAVPVPVRRRWPCVQRLDRDHPAGDTPPPLPDPADPPRRRHGRAHGPGLDPEQKQRLFEPFYTTKTKGTGLGLSITKRIVEAHGGRIAVGENGGPGAEIILTLPRGGSP